MFVLTLGYILSFAGHAVEGIQGDKVRLFRAEKQYAITSGKWYFEFEAVTTGEMRVGWARPNVRAGTDLGADELAYVFNGNRVCKDLCAHTSIYTDYLSLVVYLHHCLLLRVLVIIK